MGMYMYRYVPMYMYRYVPMYMCRYVPMYMCRYVPMYVFRWVTNTNKEFIYIYTDLLCKFLKLYETKQISNLYMTYEKYMSYKANFKLQRYKLKIKLHLQKVYKIVK